MMMVSNLLNSEQLPHPTRNIICRDALPCVSTVVFILCILLSPSLGRSQYKLKPSKPKETLVQPKKKILILDRTDLSTEKSPGSLSKAIPKILKTQLESERVMGDFNSKNSYYFYTRKELRKAMKKAKITKEDFQDPQKVIKLGWTLKADLVMMTSYRVTDGKLEVQIQVLSVKEERIVLIHTSKPVTEVYVALDLFINKHYNTIEKIPNLPPTDPSKLLILDLADQSGVSNYPYLSKRIPEIMKDNLLNIRDFNILPRSRFLEVMERRKFVNTDLKEKKNALSIARELGAVVVIYGTYKKRGDEVILSIYVVDVETGKVLYKYKGENLLGQKELNKLTQNFIAGESKRPKSVFKSMPKPIPYKYSKTVGLKGGFPVILGHIGGKTAFKLPYFGITYKQNFYNSKTAFWELELGYFAYRSKDTFIDSITEHVMPVTLSLVWDIKLGGDFLFHPKIGLGYMIFYSETNIPNLKSGFGGAILLKPSIELDYTIGKDWMIVLEGTFFIAQDVKEHRFGNFDYYLIPSLGVTYRF